MLSIVYWYTVLMFRSAFYILLVVVFVAASNSKFKRRACATHWAGFSYIAVNLTPERMEGTLLSSSRLCKNDSGLLRQLSFFSCDDSRFSSTSYLRYLKEYNRNFQSKKSCILKQIFKFVIPYIQHDMGYLLMIISII